MQRAVPILAALFATAAVLAVAAVLAFVAAAMLDAQRGTLPIDNKHLLADSLITTGGLAFAGIYATIARSIWQRRNWKRTRLFSAVTILFFPVGTVLGICALILLTRPAVRATFRE